jgi:hypothetical protein
MSDLDAQGIPAIEEESPGMGPDGEPLGGGAGRQVGRLVRPDQGAGLDDEPTEVAEETEDGGALSAEESAMHITDLP